MPLALELFKDRPGTPFGYYSETHDALIMNIATGGGTLVHEIVHPFMASNFPACPSWFNEGLASLYEQCGDKDGHIRGRTNWRLKGLQEAIRQKAVPSFKTLCKTSTHQFYNVDPGTNYSQARYLCYYLQEEGKLSDYYRKFLAARKTDKSGYATLVSSNDFFYLANRYDLNQIYISDMSKADDVYKFINDNKIKYIFSENKIDENVEKISEEVEVVEVVEEETFIRREIQEIIPTDTAPEVNDPEPPQLSISGVLNIVKKKAPSLICDGEIQFDAAIIPSIAEKKGANNILNGMANVFIFPSLDSANIGQKIAEQIGGYFSVGPMIQGLRKSVHHLPKSCSTESVINTALLGSFLKIKN